ncbi:MAG: 1-deoxy-D-xylulose-5-phosphate reductoisomerase, partial [Gammaproteobacteria bacterium]|nr:1-deoxy-D-xylulose-5-phosphate reductoisomerase [Gammaproteobacteria bacterium]
STLDVLSRHRNSHRVVGLTANTDVETLVGQCAEWHPQYAVMADVEAAELLERRLKGVDGEIRVLAGVEGLQTVASLSSVDYVMAAIVGAAGLLPSLAAARAGKRVLLANKEALVMSGALFMDAVRENGAELLPIDSEHNAIFQCMPAGFRCGLDTVGVKRILLTASGGPFRHRSSREMESVTPEEACAHPNWVMGRKISVDSATMMNKGLEVIEACWLFNTEVDKIQVLLHSQSIIHSMIEYMDGSVLAQLGNPDMRIPIAHALAWPERMKSGVDSLDLIRAGRLDFEAPDLHRFPCLRLAMEVAAVGGTAGTVLNAANEVAVDAFLNRRITFTDIPKIIESVLSSRVSVEASDLDMILNEDQAARRIAGLEVSGLVGGDG